MSFLFLRAFRPLKLALSATGLPMVTAALAAMGGPLLAAPIPPSQGPSGGASERAAGPVAEASFEQRVLNVIRRHPAVLIEALNAYEREQQVARSRQQSDQLRRLYPRPQDLIGDAPVRGNGQVALVMFSDFQCAYCAQAHDVLTDFLRQRGKNLRLVYKHFPLTQIHPQALPAARAAWAAGRQGQFWAYHDALFANQARLGDPLYREIASGLNLNLERFDRDRNSDAALRAIQADLEQAQRLGLGGTPTLVMDQRILIGPITVAELGKQLEASLAATSAPSPTRGSK